MLTEIPDQFGVGGGGNKVRKYQEDKERWHNQLSRCTLDDFHPRGQRLLTIHDGIIPISATKHAVMMMPSWHDNLLLTFYGSYLRSMFHNKSKVKSSQSKSVTHHSFLSPHDSEKGTGDDPGDRERAGATDILLKWTGLSWWTVNHHSS